MDAVTLGFWWGQWGGGTGGGFNPCNSDEGGDDLLGVELGDEGERGVEDVIAAGGRELGLGDRPVGFCG